MRERAYIDSAFVEFFFITIIPWPRKCALYNIKEVVMLLKPCLGKGGWVNASYSIGGALNKSARLENYDELWMWLGRQVRFDMRSNYTMNQSSLSGLLRE